MKATKWILTTAALAALLSTGALAEEHDGNRGRDRDDAAYAQRYHRDRDDYSNNGYRQWDRAMTGTPGLAAIATTDAVTGMTVAETATDTTN